MNTQSQTPLKILVTDAGPAAPHPELQQLEQLGHKLDHAASVDEAVAALDREAYDVVLMDVERGTFDQDCVARLAESAKSSPGGPRFVPVGDALNLALPTVGWRSLVQELPALARRAGSAAPTAPTSPVLIDPAKALEAADGDQELLGSLVELFFEQLPTITSAIRSGIDHRKAEQVERNAHSLKGSVSIFGAKAVRQVAHELEHIGKEALWEEAEGKWTLLNIELLAVEPELRALGARASAGQLVA